VRSTTQAPFPLVLSLRAAGRLLHTDRGQVAELVQRGVLKSVPWGASRRIPLAEVERLAREGWTKSADGRPRRAPKPKHRPADAAAAIERLDVEAL
jgi:hypothetical protein